MPDTQFPRFIIYQPNTKEYYICLEVEGKFLRWCSIYPPTLDVNFPREVTRIDDIPVKNRPRKQIYDEGTYALTQSKKDPKEAIEATAAEGIASKSFSFILNGKVLKGRFAFKRTGSTTVIQKFKDKFAREEDVLSGDLIRTIHTMVPDYDETKVKLNYSKKTRRKEAPEKEVEPVEEVTADKTIGGIDYHFAFYSSDNEPDICLVTEGDNAVLVLKEEKGRWMLQAPVSKGALKNERKFTEHAGAWHDEINS